MKHILTKSHKLLAGMLALLLCITAVFPLSAAALDTDVPAAQILLSEENGVLKVPHSDISSTVVTTVSSLNNTYAANKAVSETARSAVDAIVTGLLSLSEKIDISSYHLQFESFFAVYQEAVLRPEFFYVDKRFSYSYNATTNEIISVTPVYTMRGTELLEAQKQYNAGLNEL